MVNLEARFLQKITTTNILALRAAFQKIIYLGIFWRYLSKKNTAPQNKNQHFAPFLGGVTIESYIFPSVQTVHT